MSSSTCDPPRADDVPYVAKVWFELCGRREVPVRVAVELFAGLLLRYSEDGRAYHDLRHIRDCLEVLEENAVMAEDLDALRWALIFHDAVHDTVRDDGLNVLESAELAAEGARRAGLPPSFADAVRKLVKATTHSDDELWTADERLIADIDLVVLAWPWELFCEYGERIRREYGWALDDECREGRAAFFEKMLGRPVVYLTEPLRRRYEERARANMARGLQVLLCSFEAAGRTKSP